MRLTLRAVPALGDVRRAAHGDVLWLVPGVTQRRDWSRYAEALAQAITRGAEVRWERL